MDSLILSMRKRERKEKDEYDVYGGIKFVKRLVEGFVKDFINDVEEEGGSFYVPPEIRKMVVYLVGGWKFYLIKRWKSYSFCNHHVMGLQKKSLGIIEEELFGYQVKFRVKGILLGVNRDRNDSVALGCTMPQSIFKKFRKFKLNFCGEIYDFGGNVYRVGKSVKSTDYYQPVIIWEPVLDRSIFGGGIRMKFMAIAIE